jgi:hypothetical protein
MQRKIPERFQQMGCIHAATQRQLFQVAPQLHLDMLHQLHIVHAVLHMQYQAFSLLFHES